VRIQPTSAPTASAIVYPVGSEVPELDDAHNCKPEIALDLVRVAPGAHARFHNRTVFEQRTQGGRDAAAAHSQQRTQRACRRLGTDE
jgi:hypothetical protein